MKFGIFYELQLPRPWTENGELKLYQDALTQVELADRTGYDYAWIDRDKGIARLPISEAMRRLAERGNAAYAAPVQPERTPTLGSRGGASSAVLSPGAGPGAVNTPATIEPGKGLP